MMSHHLSSSTMNTGHQRADRLRVCSTDLHYEAHSVYWARAFCGFFWKNNPLWLGKVSWNTVINQGERKHLNVIIRINKAKNCFLQYQKNPLDYSLNFKEPKGEISPSMFSSGTAGVPHIWEMQVSSETSAWALFLSLTSAEF